MSSKWLTLVLLGIVLVAGCIDIESVTGFNNFSFQNRLRNIKVNSTYLVIHYSRDISSAGTRCLNICYSIENGEVVSYNGTYTADMTDGKFVYGCDS